MNIIVCIKQVPDTTEIKLDPVKGTLIREGVPSIMNPDDKGGLELALRLKDQHGATVTVVTMGPPQSEAILREAFAMGADKAILLSDRKFGGADTWATSYTLSAALRKLDYDLIITGRQAIDGDTAQVGPRPAASILCGIGRFAKRRPHPACAQSHRGRLSTARGAAALFAHCAGFGQQAPLHVGPRHHGDVRPRNRMPRLGRRGRR